MLNKKNPKENFYCQTDQKELDFLSKKVKESEYLPKYHIYPESGLMNDPNGLAYFNQEYHVFFQWYPFDSVHGLKHWGHTASKDLLFWTEQEMALIPNQEFEKDGCYSGNAFEYDDKLYLFYTANYKTKAGKLPKQALAIMDKNRQIEKQADPIIDETPAGLSGELRDPYVFEREGTFYMLLGGSQFESEPHPGFGDKGVLVLYQSQNLFDWDYAGLIDIPIETGYMLECPSLITIDGKDVLFLSPMGLKPDKIHYQNRFATIQLTGKLNLKKMGFEIEHAKEMDAGFDFYAPQAFYGENKVPMMFAWFGCGEPVYPTEEGWKHGLSLPQELTIDDNGVVRRFPAGSILDHFDDLKEVKGSGILVPSKYYRLQFESDFSFKIGTEEDYWSFEYNTEKAIAIVSREYLKLPVDLEYGLTRRVKIADLKKVDVFVDHSFIEIYLNDGEEVFSFRVFQNEKDFIFSPGKGFRYSLYNEENGV